MLVVRLRTVLCSAMLLLAAASGGCGDDDRAPARLDATAADGAMADGAAASDVTVARLDGQQPGTDTQHAPADGPMGSDSGWPNTGAASEPQRASVDAIAVDVRARASSVDASAADADAQAPSVEAGSASAEAQPLVPATIVVLPDTQYYAAAYPEVFAQQTDWIVAHKDLLNIGAVLHVGDVVDAPSSPDQWNVASKALRRLDNVVPYLLVPGNHDTDANRQGLLSATFAPTTMPWLGGTMVQGQTDNSYAVVDIGGKSWLLLGLEFGPRDAVVTWADTVLKAYPTTPAIIVTHAYLYRDGTRYDVAKAGVDPNASSYQHFFPAWYGFTADQGINDGEMLWQKLVLPNPNVRLVCSGHDTGGARLRSTRPDGSVVHQMLSDYQWLDQQNFGFGYLRVLQLDYAKKTISVETYSPYLQQYLTDADNQFTLDLYY